MPATDEGIAVTVIVDRDRCIGSQNCVRDVPSVFRIDDDGLAVADGDGPVPFATLTSAARNCPTEAIEVVRH